MNALVAGLWLALGIAYVNQPPDVGKINDRYIQLARELDAKRIAQAAPEFAGIQVKEVDGVLIRPLDLGQLDIPQSELRLAAQEISEDDWKYIQLKPYPPRLQNPEGKVTAKNPRPHDARVIDKQLKIAIRSVVKPKKRRRISGKPRRTNRKRQVAKLKKSTRSKKKAKTNKKRLRVSSKRHRRTKTRRRSNRARTRTVNKQYQVRRKLAQVNNGLNRER